MTPVKVEIGGKVYPLVFTWSRVLELETRWGLEHGARASRAIGGGSLADLAELVEIGGGPAASEVIEASPPRIALQNALARAYRLHFWPPDELDAQEKAEADEPPGKWNALVRWFGRFIGRP